MMTNSGRWSKMLDPTTLDGSIPRSRLESSEIRKRSVIGEEQKVGEEKPVDECATRTQTTVEEGIGALIKTR